MTGFVFSSRLAFTIHNKQLLNWAVDQLADVFRTTHRAKTQQVIRSRGQDCGDIELAGYLSNETGPGVFGDGSPYHPRVCWTFL